MSEKNYVITTAQKGAKPHWNFLRGLEKYAKRNKAEIIILSTNGKKTTSRRGKDSDDTEFLNPVFARTKYNIIEARDFKLNRNLYIRNFPVKAQQMIPLTSWGRFVQFNKSAIMASPKQMMKVHPNSYTSLPKILMSTGAVTMPNYRDNSWGTKAKLDHVNGAIVVNVKNNIEYHYRQLLANYEGVFFDLGVRYDGRERISKERLEALIPGDIHTGSHDDRVIRGLKEMLAEYKPKRLILHDLFDGRSVNHHEKDNIMVRSILAENNNDSLYDELASSGKMLKELKKAGPKDMQIIVIKSNHDEFIDRYLKEGRFVSDPINFRLSCYLGLQMLEGNDVLESGIKYTYGEIPGVTFLSRGKDYKVKGWQLAAHGDKGSNGARASVRTLEASLGPSITGHSHTPEIFRNAWKVGTSTKLNLDYLSGGASSWLNTHAFLHANGRPQLINIINGRYR